MGIVKTGKIQSMGDPLGERYVKSLWFEQINSGASGTLTPPSQGEIVLDQWSAGVDALASTIASGIPAFVSPVTSGGVIITATLDASGNWTLSGTPSSYPIAIVYVYQIKFKFFDYTKQLGGYELIPSAAGVFTDVANFGDKLSPADTTVQKALDTLDDHAHAGVYEPYDLAIQIHITGTGSPHTAAGVGADPAGTGHTEAATHVGVHEGAYIHSDIALNTAVRHTPISLAVSADVLLALSTQEIGLDTQTANYIFAGPVSGAVAAPTFRAMVAADLGTGLSPTFAGIVIADAGTIGLGSGKGLIQFDDETIDTISFMNANVGIGTTTPDDLLSLVKSTSGAVGGRILIANLAANAANSAADIAFRISNDYAGGYYSGRIANIHTGTTNLSDLAFFLYDAVAPGGTEKMRIYNNGNVNITGVLKVDNVQVVSNRVVDATIDNSIEAAFTTLYPLASALLNGIRTAQKTHGLMAAA